MFRGAFFSGHGVVVKFIANSSSSFSFYCQFQLYSCQKNCSSNYDYS